MFLVVNVIPLKFSNRFSTTIATSQTAKSGKSDQTHDLSGPSKHPDSKPLISLMNFLFFSSISALTLKESDGSYAVSATQQNETKLCCCCCNQFCTLYLIVFRSWRWYQITAINLRPQTKQDSKRKRFLQDGQLRECVRV